ncbi:MAG TPA: CBS domain-containing protein [Euzebyales bacterium]|nr:CBS domain-containing protein [Euzebyales bacterium]
MTATRRRRVDEVMTRDPIVLREHDSVRVGGLTLLRHRISAAPVVDHTDQLVGLFSQSDVLARFAAPRDRRGPIARFDERHARAETVGEACSRPVAVISPDAAVDTAARELLDRDIGRLIVVLDGKVLGVVSRSDVLKLFLPDDDRLRPQLSYMEPD